MILKIRIKPIVTNIEPDKCAVTKGQKTNDRESNTFYCEFPWNKVSQIHDNKG